MSEAGNEFWIRPGIFVQQAHRTGPIMTVTRLVREPRSIHVGNGKRERKLLVKGVLCRWTDSFGQPQSGTFHTKELVEWNAQNA